MQILTSSYRYEKLGFRPAEVQKKAVEMIQLIVKKLPGTMTFNKLEVEVQLSEIKLNSEKEEELLADLVDFNIDYNRRRSGSKSSDVVHAK